MSERIGSVVPRNLLGRIVIRVLVIEWWACQIVLLTIAAITLAVVGAWGWAASLGVASAAGWAYIVWDEAQARGDETLPPSNGVDRIG